MKYEKRGVSASKQDVHNAIKNMDKGLYPNAFCKILPDTITNSKEHAIVMHADTAGTKTSLAYLYWKETGDLSVWKGIAQDAIVMNLDDMACSGFTDNFIFSSTIGRNKNLISGDVISTLINAAQEFFDKLNELDISIKLSGGETADVGDIVRTIDVGYTAFSRQKKQNIIDINIRPGDVIVGLESCGQSVYEDSYNSGIGSNGLTFARHEVLNKIYSEKYPESYDPSLPKDLVYSGKHLLTEASGVNDMNIGQLLLSPTRTYLPVLKEILNNYHDKINGVIHCTGGGHSKILHFIKNLRIVKNNILPVPEVFKIIQKQSNTSWEEMFKVFNTGQRLEFYTDKNTAEKIIEISAKYNINACITGYCENSENSEVIIDSEYGNFKFQN